MPNFMKIAVCSSMTFSPEMIELKKELNKLGHEVTIPEFTEKYAALESRDGMHLESSHNKVTYSLIKGYFEVIKDHDAVLIYNGKKAGIENYIGGNTFLEMGFAHVLDKNIFLYNPIPDVSYKDELEAMKPKVINGDLTKIL
jgi:hypothetical protein